MASKLSDMQIGDSMDIGQLLTKKELKQTRWRKTNALFYSGFLSINTP